MSVNNEIIQYVETLDNYDEKNPEIQSFIKKLNKPIIYQGLLDHFAWKAKQYTALDKKLIELGYAGRDDDINSIKMFLTDKIEMMSLAQFNFIFKANIYNHMDLFDKDINSIQWTYLSRNPAAIKKLEANQSKVRYRNLAKNSRAVNLWSRLVLGSDYFNHGHDHFDFKMVKEGLGLKHISQNPAAIDLVSNSPEIIDWYYLSRNPAAIKLLKQNPDKIHWDMLSVNSAAVKMLIKNPEKINWKWLSMNPAKEAIELLKQNPEKISWTELSMNPAAMELLEQNLDKISWTELSQNPSAIELLEQNLDKIDWYGLSMNPAAIELLRQNPEKINWDQLALNPYDFNQAKIDHFNSMHLFPRSQLELTNPDPIDYKKIFVNLMTIDALD